MAAGIIAGGLFLIVLAGFILASVAIYRAGECMSDME